MAEEQRLSFVRTDIYQGLDASLDLDAQVALRMGWKYHDLMRHGLPSWFSPDGKQYARPPRFSYDLNLAWAAALSLPCGISINTFNNLALNMYVTLTGGGGGAGSDGSRLRPAVALCRAICAWVDAEEKPASALT